MGNFWNLIKIDFKVLMRYKIIFYEFMTAAVLVPLILIVGDDKDIINDLFSMLVMIISFAMPTILSAIRIFYEKKEGVFRSIMVSPVSFKEYLISKSITTGLVSLFTITVFIIVVMLTSTINVGLGLVVFIIVLHIMFSLLATLLGFLAAMIAKDFNVVMLVSVIPIIVISIVPTLFKIFNINSILGYLFITEAIKKSIMIFTSGGGFLNIFANTLYNPIITIIVVAVFIITLLKVVLKKSDKYLSKEY